jgi:hypothetical protein
MFKNIWDEGQRSLPVKAVEQWDRPKIKECLTSGEDSTTG